MRPITLLLKFNPETVIVASELEQTGDIICLKLDDQTEYSTILKHKFPGDYLRILTVNIRSVNANLDSFLVFVSSLDTCVDVIVLTECWINENSIIPTISNYNSFSTTRSYNQNDGVIAYTRDYLNVEVSEPDTVLDGNCLVLRVNSDYSIICSYRPYCFSNPANYIASLNGLLKNIHSKNIVFTGDINIDIMPESIKGQAAEYVNLMAAFGLAQGVDRPTHQRTCLDHFMVKSQNKAHTIVFNEFTDHSPIMLLINSTLKKSKTINYNKIHINTEEIAKSLQNHKWDEFLAITDTNVAAESLVNTLKAVIENNTTVITIPKRKQPMKPWITMGVLKSIKKRDKLHKKIKANTNNDNIKEEYTKYRNICNRLIKQLKKDYYEREFCKSTGNPKETWRVIKEICSLNKTKVSSAELLKIRTTCKESLDEVNNYFTSIGNRLANETLTKLNTTESNLASLASSRTAPSNSMMLHPTDPTEMSQTIKMLKLSSAVGWDNIPTTIIKKCSQLLASPLAHMCNLSLESGTFPSIFKKGIVCPIFKTGDKKLPSNYRPITLLTTLTKILEKIMNKRLVKYLETNNLLSGNQYGFRSGRSTEDAVMKLTSMVTRYVDRGEKCVGVFLDLQKAFDTVCVPILLARLENLGVRGSALAWFADYLTNREQAVRIEKQLSGNASCTYGVPQGSTLGPTLFLTYINELCKLDIDKADLIMFADDTVILFHGKNWVDAKHTAENGLAKVTCWLEDSLLSLNTMKTKYLCFSKTAAGSPDDNLSVLTIHTYPCNRRLVEGVSCNCDSLSRVPNIKYLGVIVDDKLNWGPHITATSKRIRKLIFIFKNLRLYANRNIVLQTYNALCHCVIEYCICAWGGASKSILVEAERAQRAVLKVLLFAPWRHPTTQVYTDTNVLTVRQTYIHKCIRRYHSLVVPHLPNSTKRIYRFPIPLVKSAHACRQYDSLVPRLYTKLNKKINIINDKSYGVKTKVYNWLRSLDYDATERLLTSAV